MRTLGETRTQDPGNLLDQGVGSQESVVLASELLDKLLVLVELLQVVGGHGVNTTVLGTIDIVLVSENASSVISSESLPDLGARRLCLPDGHVRAGNLGEPDGTRETLVTLGVIVLQANCRVVSRA